MLVWTTNKRLSVTLAVLTLVAGVLPAGIAYVGAQIVDAVIHAAELHRQQRRDDARPDVLRYVAPRGLAGRRHLHGPARAFRSRSPCCARSWASASTS